MKTVDILRYFAMFSYYNLSFILLTATTDSFTETKTVTVPASWKKVLDFTNDNSNQVSITTKTIKGFSNAHRDQKTIKASTTISEEFKAGVEFQAKGAAVKVGGSVGGEHTWTEETVTMNEQDIYGSTTLEMVTIISAGSRIIKWQLVANVGGEEIAFDYFIDTDKVTETMPIQESTATIAVRKQIVQGETKFRIMHKEKKQFITVVSRKNWPAATLSANSGFYFQIGSYKAYGGYRIFTWNTTSPGYDVMYSSAEGGVYFDVQNDNSKQFWIVSKEPPFYLGDTVSLMNGYWSTAALTYYDGPATKVYCLTYSIGTEQQWVFV